jgi:hypothetical protein
MNEKCSRCGSDKMMEDVYLTTDVGYRPGDIRRGLMAYVQSDPQELLFKGTVYGALRARVCGGCGYTEIYTSGFQQLYKAYQHARQPSQHSTGD